jgi:hypothetical protein
MSMKPSSLTVSRGLCVENLIELLTINLYLPLLQVSYQSRFSIFVHERDHRLFGPLHLQNPLHAEQRSTFVQFSLSPQGTIAELQMDPFGDRINARR